MSKYYPLNEEQARTAWNMSHMGSFRSDASEYQAEVDGAYNLAEEAADRNPERAEEAHGIADRYAKKLADWYNKKYRIDSMCPSILISGGGNFPVHKKQKQNQAWDNLYKELKKIETMKDRIRKIGTSAETIKADDENAADKLRAKIKRMKDNQEAMKAANREARKAGEKAPYPSYTLSNNNQNIRATEQRLKRLEATKDKGTSQHQIEFMGESVMVVENAELMRLQLIFDGKPSEEIRAALKKNGFRWSPKNSAWQRQLTNNARHALRWMIDQSKREVA